MSVGLGAGIFYVPLLTILGKFYLKEAVPISKFLIFVSSTFTSFYHMGERHPKYEFKSLIDYNLVFFYSNQAQAGCKASLYFIF